MPQLSSQQGRCRRGSGSQQLVMLKTGAAEGTQGDRRDREDSDLSPPGGPAGSREGLGQRSWATAVCSCRTEWEVSTSGLGPGFLWVRSHLTPSRHLVTVCLVFGFL